MAAFAELGAVAETASRTRTTASLTRFVVDTRYEDIPAPIVHATKRLILDEIVVTAAAINTPMAKALLKLKLAQGGAPDATLLVGGQKLPTQSVAYVHTQLANLLDADETMLNRMHTVCASVMPGLAIAEKHGGTGKDLIAAIATGYDITARVGLSLSQFVPDGKGGLVFAPLFGWSWMTFGATATVGRLLGLDAHRLAMALGQALVTTPVSFDIAKHTLPEWTDGIPANWHKYQMGGAMAEAAINAAELASYGWVARSDVLDEGEPFWRSFGAVGCDWKVLYGDLGSHWYIGDCAIKPYPFCRFGHAALDIFTDIVRANTLTADAIEHVIFRAPPHELCEMLGKLVVVDDPLKLLHSIPTAFALIALGIPPGPAWFEADLRSDLVRQFARRVRYEIDPSWGQILVEQQLGDGYFRRLPTEVIVRTRQGAEFRARSDYAKGDPWAPGYEMTDVQLSEKARSFLAGILPRDNINRLIDAVLTLDKSPNVSALVAAGISAQEGGKA